MKIFLSHAMSKLMEDEVLSIREKAIKKLKEIYGNDIEIIENYYHENAPKEAGQLWHLGRSIQQMEEADLIVFIENHGYSRGCLIEKFIVSIYSLPNTTLHI